MKAELARISPARTLHDFSYTALERELAPLSGVHTRALWRALYRDLKTEPAGEYQRPLQRWLEEHTGCEGGLGFDFPRVASEILSTDELTQKYLLELTDGQTIETVLMGYTGRSTGCVSTQAGCAMGCVFCATGQMGFVRHLRPGEIVAQVLHLQRMLRQRGEAPLRNLVLMGMGEPLHNYDSVMTALDIISDARGLNVAASRITISTVGVAPAIRRLAEEGRPYNLAVSLHGASEEERARLVPASKRWSLAEVIAACRDYDAATGKRIFFEWTLIAGQNDSREQARRLAELLQGINGHINLIPLNPTNAFAGAASETGAGDEFQRVLRDAGFPVTFRQRRGIDVAAGCGQLRAEKTRRREERAATVA